MDVRFFNPGEVNHHLPALKDTVREILACGQKARMIMAMPSPLEHQRHLLDLEERIKDLIAQLEVQGFYFKDWNFEIGLVDFPAIINGQQALLCWRSDEPQVEWFHSWDNGYAGRRPITKDLVFS